MAWRGIAGKLIRDRRGAVAVEYGFLIALIVIGIILAIRGVGRANLDVWTNVAAKITAAT